MNKVKNNKLVNSSQNFFNNLGQRIFSSNAKSGSRKFMNSIWAIAIGIIVMLIFVSIAGFNVNSVVENTWRNAFSIHTAQFQKLFAIYILGALAVGIGFKAGLFNIGVPGQMMIAGGLSLLIIFADGTNTGPEQFFAAFVVAILAGAATGAFAGILKAFFKVHEVVATIMLNWIIFFAFKQIFIGNNSFVHNYQTTTGGNNSKTIDQIIGDQNPSYQFIASGQAIIWICLIGAILVALSLFVVMQYTTFGYRVKMIGLNRYVASYAGTNEKFLTIIIFALSGALSGIAGYLYFVIWRQSIDFNGNSPIETGFNVIAVSLIAYNSPLGIVFSSLFYSAIEIGFSNISLTSRNSVQFQYQYYYILIGILMLLISMSIIFGNIRPIHFIRRTYVIFKHSNYFKKSSKAMAKFKTETLNKVQTHEQVEQLVTALNKSDLGIYQKGRIYKSVIKRIFKDAYKKALTVKKQNEVAIKTEKKSLKDLHLKVVSSKYSNEERSQFLNQLADQRIIVNEKLTELGSFAPANLKAEYKAKVKQVSLLRKKYLRDYATLHWESLKETWLLAVKSSEEKPLSKKLADELKKHKQLMADNAIKKEVI
ncbi:ABC transporter permease [Mycoplasmopsis agassizii]|uniref:ABC transporter permease n=1 Tax=Mycoplasmopsis agassizii TaxID=33922 RepID=UPI00352737E5